MTERETEILASLKGGQLWQQAEFPDHQRYTIRVPGGRFIFSSTEPIGMASTDMEGKWLYTDEEAAGHLAKYKFALVSSEPIRVIHVSEVRGW